MEKISYYIFLVFVFLLPLTFSPYQYVNFFFSKTILLSIIVLVGLFLVIFKIFKEGKYKLYWHPFFIVFLFIPLWYLFSSLFASNTHSSLFGTGLETDTTSFIGLLFLLTLIIIYFIKAKDKILITYFVFGVSYILFTIHQILRLFFGPNFLSFHIFLTTTSNTIGKWNEVAIISGIAALLSLLSVEFLRLSRAFKIFSYVILVLSTFLVAITNFDLLVEKSFSISFFSLIGVFALIFFVYFLSSTYENSKSDKEDSTKRKIPIASLVLLIISVIFTFGHSQIGSYIQNHFQISSYEERPTWKETMQVSLASIKQKPFTGYGPNNFKTSWVLNRPADVNLSPVWNDDFISGVSNITSTIVTLGPIGFIAWLIFLGFLIYLGFKSLFFKYKDKFSHYITVSSFLITLFLWIVSFTYVLTTVMLVMTFVFTGLFLASLMREGIIKEKTFTFENSKEKTFASILILVIVLVGSIFWFYASGVVLAANVYGSKGAVVLANATSDTDLNTAQDYYVKALRLDPSDAYLRAIANLNLSKAQYLVNNSSLSGDALRSEFINTYQNAYGASNDALKYDDSNYQNYIIRGSVSESIASLGAQTIEGSGIGDAYEDSKNYYHLAEKLNPRSPIIPLLLARLELTKKNFDNAKQEISNSLVLKPNYADAYILLSQIQLSQNDQKGAIDTLVSGSIVAPDSNLFFNLGLIYFSNKDYKNAVNAFEKSVILNQYYSNARYYLALSYYNEGRTDDALIQLEQIKLLNPNSTDIDSMITTFKAGNPVVVPNNDLNSTSTNSVNNGS